MNTSQNAERQIMLAVRIGGAVYALPVDAIEEVLPALPIDSLPRGPDYLRGVVFVRGQLIPVLDLAVRLGVVRDRPLEPPVVCVRLQGRTVGCEVDEVLDLLEIDWQQSLSADTFGGDGALAAVVEIGGRMIGLLDARRLGIEDTLEDQAAAIC